MRGLVPGLLGVVVAGLTVGVWLWLCAVPSGRVLLPNGEVGFAAGPAAVPLPLALASGVAGLSLVWLAVGFLLARRTGRRLGDVLAGTGLLYLPLLLLLIDAARLCLPLGWLTDPLVVLTYDGRVVLAGALALAVTALHVQAFGPGWWPWLSRPGRLAVSAFAVACLAYLAFVPRAVLLGPTGDEPDYLLLAHSLLVDCDFDLRDNVERQDYRRFAPRVTLHAQPGPGGGLYDTHRLGLPAYIAPAYGAALLAGWPVRLTVVVFLSVTAALLVGRIVAWAATLTGHPPSALLAGLAVGWSAPVFFYAHAIYPEGPVALLQIELVRRLAAPGGRHPGLVGLLLASLPWFHEKFLLLTVVLTGAAVWVFRSRRRALGGLLVPVAVSAVLQAGYYLVVYGRPLPLGAYPVLPAPAAIPNGLVGLWLDRDHGLLPLAPVYLLAFAGLPAFWREQRRAAVLGLLAAASLYVVVGVYREWWGGFAPPPRYLVPAMPVLGVAAAFGARAALAAGRLTRVLCLVGVSVATATYGVVYPALQYRHAHPLRAVFAGVDWPRYLPSWVAPDARTLALTAVAVVVAAVWAVGRTSRGPAGPSGVRAAVAAALAVSLVAAVVLAGDHLSGAPGPSLTPDTANREIQALLLRLAERDRLTLRSRRPLPDEPLQLVYEAERLPGHGAQTVRDPLAANGAARAGGVPEAHLVFGPYAALPAGSYRARFRLRREPGGETGPVGALDVTGEHGAVALATRPLSAADVPAERYADVDVPFALAAPTWGLEWRVRRAGPGLRVDRISLVVLGRLTPGPGE